MSRGTLGDYLVQDPAADRLRLALDITEGLKYLHHIGILHGDLKSANILVNEQHRALLVDFGLVTLYYSRKLPTVAPIAGSIRWTAPELIDPEQFGLEKAEYSPQSDVYALSMVFWELFTGRVPFYQHIGDLTVIPHILRGTRPLRPVQARCLGLFEDIWCLIEACWQAEWQKRLDRGMILGILLKEVSQREEDGVNHVPERWPLSMDDDRDILSQWTML
ncbi:kinase-like protein [Obba rivulosa]|uniref:Kinase-like protein n=1 Tax=Obba rivulosa TaxID=1052685 RepID=A0A8E2DN45_9APHY|nr:kinase-like protein [Obba rivulosa]